MTAKHNRKIKAQRVDPAEKLARTIVPASQVRRGAFAVVDVQNHSEGDQRATVRSGQTRTIRRTPKLHLLYPKVLNLEEVMSCEWYLGRYCRGYEAGAGVTANYGGAGGGCDKAFTHLAKSNEQMIARDEYQAARSAIDPLLVGLFERVVIHGRPMGRLGLSFRKAVAQLSSHMGQTQISS